MRLVFGLPLRQAGGFLRSLFRLIGGDALLIAMWVFYVMKQLSLEPW